VSAYLGTAVVTATGGYPVKRNKSHSIDSIVFDSLSVLGNFPVVSPSDGVARTTIQAYLFMPQAFKISKVGVYCSAIDATSGDYFNIVVGAGTPNASGIANNTAPPDNQRNYGYPQAFAAAGNLVFGNDVQFNTTNFPNLATGTGGYNEFEPVTSTGAPNYDGCYLPGVYTLRVVTNASTGSISNLCVAITGCLIDTNCAANFDAQPTVDY
jgi:hypothetical protein